MYQIATLGGSYWYGSVEEIADPGKALVGWLKDGGMANGVRSS